MKFAHPAFLFALVTLAFPIFLHFYNLRKYKKLYFSNLQFVKKIDEESRSTKKLKHLLVLISRCLALALAVFAFAQPYIPSKKEGKVGANVIAIYIDNSFSMTLKGTEGELLSEAKEAAKKLVKKSSNATRFLITSNALSGTENQLCSKNDAIDRIDKIKTSALTRFSENVLNWQRERLNSIDQQLEKIGQRSYVFFSDFQESTSKLGKLQNDENASYYPIQVVAQNKQNVYIDSVWFTSPFRKVGNINELMIRVKQTNPTATNTEVNVKIGDVNRNLFVEFKDKKEAIVNLSFTENSEGWKNGVVKVQDSEITFDDTYFFSYEVKKQINILVADGESKQTGVTTVFSLDTYFKTTTLNLGAMSPDALTGMDLFVLNGANEISSGLVGTLQAFNKAGGSILLFPSENIDLNSWNAALSQIGLPQLGAPQTNATKIKSIAYEDVFFENVFETKPSQLNLPAFSKTYPILRNSNAKSLIQLQNGTPVFVSTLGERKNYLFGASLMPSFGTFTSDALFSTLLLRAAELSQSSNLLSFVIGKENDFSLQNLPKTEKAIHLKNDQFDFIPQRILTNGKTSFGLNDDNALEILQPGIALLEGENKIAEIALNFDRNESNCSTLKIEEIKSLFEAKGITKLNMNSLENGANQLDIDLKKSKEFWRTCLLLALLFLIVEMSLIKFMK